MSALSDYTALVKALRRARVEAGLSQAELGKRVCVTDQAISNWERCGTMPQADNLLFWAEALGYRVVLEPKDAQT